VKTYQFFSKPLEREVLQKIPHQLKEFLVKKAKWYEPQRTKNAFS
jgi:hypothetical protein